MKTAVKLCLLLIGLLMAGEAAAQRSPSPGDVNRCTQLTDPTQLRLCIEAQQGVTNQPGGLIAEPGVAGPAPHRRLDDRGGRRKKRRLPP
jgi:hypothetical protein